MIHRLSLLRQNPVAGRLLRATVIAVIVAFWAIYLWRNAGLLLEHDWELNLPLVALAVVLGAIAYAWYGIAWVVSFRTVGGTIGLRRGLRRWSQSIVMRYVPGGVWHIAGRALLLRGDRQPVPVVLVSAFLEMAFASLTAALCVGLGLLIAPLPWPLPLLGVPIALAVVIAVLPRVFRLWIRLGTWPIATMAARLPAGESGRTDYHQVFAVAVNRPGFVRLLLALAPYLIGFLFAIASLVLTGAALGADPLTMARVSLAAFAASWILGFVVPFTPGGLGLREGTLAVLIDPFIGPALAIGTALLSRVVFTAGEAIMVGATAGLMPVEPLGEE